MSSGTQHGTDGDPMRRSPALAVVPSHVERAFCPWCTHSQWFEPAACEAAARREPSGAMQWCKQANPDGRCDAFEPSFWTRLRRRFGRRQPVLIEAIKP